jgi:hypothetical protein
MAGSARRARRTGIESALDGSDREEFSRNPLPLEHLLSSLIVMSVFIQDSCNGRTLLIHEPIKLGLNLRSNSELRLGQNAGRLKC